MAAAPSTTPAPPYLAQLQRRALDRQLDQHPLWHSLLHYKRLGGIGGLRSLADDPGFFNAPEGRTQPQAELSATLAAFFSQHLYKADQTAQCRFRARYEWLRDELGFDPAQLPPQPCPRYDEWREGVAAHSLTLVYAAAYINSPASMFGHTLFRLNPPPAPDAPALLAYSINYAVGTDARPDDALFELKGLFGLYAGEFSNAPYYLRVREYSHMEDRDLWEYDLDLQPAELNRLLAHTWELGFTRFNYWFFDENCSYHLLSLLDAARPSLRLTDRFTWRAIPSDTVKAVVSVPGLVKRRSYRPSATSQLLARAASHDAQQVQQALDLALADTPRPLPPIDGASPADAAQARARLLDLAERTVSSQAARGKLGNDAAQARRMQLLRQRAALPELPDVAVPEPDSAPEAGHGSLRLEWLIGRQKASAPGLAAAGGQRPVLRLNVHPAYHELLDPDAGFARGAQIRFFGAGVVLPEGRSLRLDHLMPVDVLSVAPQHPLRDGLSWKVSGGLRRAFAAAPADAPLVFTLNGGPGRAWALRQGPGVATAYALMDNQLWWGDEGRARGLRVGTGLHLGLYGDLLPAWRLQAEWRVRRMLGGARTEQSLLLRQRLQLSPGLNAVMDCVAQQRGNPGAAKQRFGECSAGLQGYW